MSTINAQMNCDEVLRRQKKRDYWITGSCLFSAFFLMGVTLFAPTYAFLFLGDFLMLLSSVIGLIHVHQTDKLVKYFYNMNPLECTEEFYQGMMKIAIYGYGDYISFMAASVFILCVLLWDLFWG